jgi:hypothetical protein
MRSVLIALCCLLAAPAAAQASSPLQLGVQDDTVFTSGNPVMSALDGLAVTKSIHGSVVRMNVPMMWTLVADQRGKTVPSKPEYDFRAYDQAILGMRSAGLTVQLTVTGPVPAWASSTKKSGVAGINATRFGQFAGAVAAHFSSSVKAISVMNEPNWPTMMAPEKSCKKVKGKKVCTDHRPATYRAIYSASYKAIKKAAPSMPVWIGELAPQGRASSKGSSISPLAFLREVLCVDTAVKKLSCAGLRTDGLAVHPYLLGEPPTAKPRYADDLSMAVLSRASTLLTKLEKKKALLTSKGKAGIPIYLTEFGYLTTKGSRAVTQSQQAKYIPQAIAMAKKASRVKQMILYQLIDPYSKSATWIGGLYTRTGTAKPVVAKLKALRY